jgi:MFS family permease
MTGGTVAHAKAQAQMLSSLGATLGSGIAPILLGPLPRRWGYFLLCTASLIVCATLFRGFSSFGTAFLAMVFVTGASTAAFYGWLPLYLPELFPTRIRATGQGLAYNSGRILAAVGALAGGQWVGFYHGSYSRMASMITLVYFVGMGLIWLAPETRHQSLPE